MERHSRGSNAVCTHCCSFLQGVNCESNTAGVCKKCEEKLRTACITISPSIQPPIYSISAPIPPASTTITQLDQSIRAIQAQISLLTREKNSKYNEHLLLKVSITQLKYQIDHTRSDLLTAQVANLEKKARWYAEMVQFAQSQINVLMQESEELKERRRQLARQQTEDMCGGPWVRQMVVKRYAGRSRAMYSSVPVKPRKQGRRAREGVFPQYPKCSRVLN